MNNYTRYTTARGFTLIEVLIALVVAVVGILAMIQLSGVFLKTVSESDQRTVATAIAEQQIENLRSFDRVDDCSVGETCFDSIASGSLLNVTVSSGQASYLFDISWNVTDNVVSGGVVSAAASVSNPYKVFKDITVTVSWDTPDAGSVSLSSVIAGVDPNLSALALNDTVNVGGEEPSVSYNPGVAPDVIAIDVGNSKLKETTKPLPEVSKNNQSTQTRFETITYRSGYELVQEDFLTVNCQCILSANGDNTVYTPTYQKYVEGEIVEVVGGLASGATGTVKSLTGSNTQSDYCSRCCANHHDTNGSAVNYSPLAGTASLAGNGAYDHKHYRISGSDPTVLVEASYGQDYLEACRFKRVNGIYRLVQDWRLKQINVFPNNALTASNALDAYVDYVIEAIRYYVFEDELNLGTSLALPSLASSAVPSLTLGVGGVDDSLSRSIYLDKVNSVDGLAAHLSSLSAASIADPNYLEWLELIPFYEVNTTLLSLWNPTSSAIATVENQTVSETYLRGRITGVASGATTVSVSMAQGNTGILGNVYNDENIYAGQQNPILEIGAGREWVTGPYDEMPVTVSASSASGTVYSITITGQVNISGSAELSSLSCTGDQVTSLASAAISGGVSYTCTVSDIPVGDDFSGTITIATPDARCSPGSGKLSISNASTNQTSQDFTIAPTKPSCP